MAGLTSLFSGLFEALGSLGSTGTGMFGDRLELAGLELREAKIRLVQFLILCLAGTGLSLLGLILLALAVVYALPPQWRLPALAALGAASLLAGLAAFLALRSRIRRAPPAFAQTLEELRKDKACF